MRLIDADALKTVLQNDQRYNVKSFDKRYDNVGFSYDQVMFTIDKQPTIEAEPIRYAYWNPDDYDYFHCSDCGYEQDEREKITRFCPGCGAKMDEPEEEE